MEVIANYRNILSEIDIYEIRLKNLERELYAVKKLYGNHALTFENYIKKNNEMCNSIAIITAILEDKKKSKKQIENKLSKLEGLEYEIAYKKFIEGKDLDTIAKELHISWSWARKKHAMISKRVNKE